MSDTAAAAAAVADLAAEQVVAPAAVRRIFTATLILGVPGAGKTSLLATFAQYLWETYHRVLLLYSWDGGAIPTDLQKLMKHGLIRFWRVRTRSGEGLGLESLYLATKGYWPASINPETGETSPAVTLVPPVTTSYTVSCRATGERLAVLPVRALVTPTWCETCRTIHPLSDLAVIEAASRTRGFDLVGGVAFDGLTSMSGVVMEHMDHARGQGHIGGEKPAFGGVVVSGSIKLGGNNRADVGFGQSRAQQFVNNSLSIPHLVEGPIFTALSMEATDEGGLPIVGAKLPGRAATDEASSWFGNVFEMGKQSDEQAREQFALYLRPFTDPQNRRHLLKTSASPDGLPDVLVDPIGQPWKQANLGLVFLKLDADLRRALSEEIPGAPGLAGTPTSYGDPFTSTTPPTAVTTVPPVAGGLPPLTAGVPGVIPPHDLTTTPGPTSSAPSSPPMARSRRTPVAAPTLAPAAVLPTEPSAAAAPVVGPVAASAPAVGTPPPPPGMRPPQRAPNAATGTGTGSSSPSSSSSS